MVEAISSVSDGLSELEDDAERLDVELADTVADNSLVFGVTDSESVASVLSDSVAGFVSCDGVGLSDCDTSRDIDSDNDALPE